MGQIIGSAAKPIRCNFSKLSSLSTPAAGQYILISSDDSMQADGQGNFDCYAIGNGTSAATALTFKKIDKFYGGTSVKLLKGLVHNTSGEIKPTYTVYVRTQLLFAPFKIEVNSGYYIYNIWKYPNGGTISDRIMADTSKTVRSYEITDEGTYIVTIQKTDASAFTFSGNVCTESVVPSFVSGLPYTLEKKQDELISGTNIATINGNSLLQGTDIEALTSDSMTYSVGLNLANLVQIANEDAEGDGYFVGWLNASYVPANTVDNASYNWRTYKLNVSGYVGKTLTFGISPCSADAARKWAIYNGSTLLDSGIYSQNSAKSVTIPANATTLYVIIADYPNVDFSTWRINIGDTLLEYTPYIKTIKSINGLQLAINDDEKKELNDAVERIAELESEMSVSYPQKKMSPSYSSTLPVISFNLDIGASQNDFDYTEEILSLFERYGLRVGIALKCESTISNSSLSFDIWERYKEWQNRGHDIINHGQRSQTYGGSSPTITTIDAAKASIYDCELALQKHGLVCNGWCSPNSVFNPDFIPILKSIYAYAFTYTESGKENTRDADPIFLDRYGIESRTIAQIESFIDSSISNGKFLVLYCHPNNLHKETTYPNFTLENLETIIQYCIAKRDSFAACVMNADDAVRAYFGLN